MNNAEKRTFENLIRVLKDRKDRDNFFKLLKLYFDGVLSLKDYHMLYTIKYSAKLKQEARDEFEKLLPSRNTNIVLSNDDRSKINSCQDIFILYISFKVI